MTSGANRSRAVAFFDIDGTLIPGPSMERRLVRALLYRRAIPGSNFALWPFEFTRLALRGIAHARQVNKIHFRGISVERAYGLVRHVASYSRLAFFPRALDRVIWHASEGHAIALISGTPQVLAEGVAHSLEARLAQQKITATFFVRSTVLQEANGRWTGRTAGEPVFGHSKAHAVRAIASRLDVDLADCYAYGNSIHDRFMLESVGRPVAVNSSWPLRFLARRRSWEIVDWSFTDQRPCSPMASSLHLNNGKGAILG